MSQTTTRSYDPIQNVIDWQLRSRFPKDHGGSIPSFYDSKEEIEDRLLAAIEKSMNTESRDEHIYRLYCEYGYKQAEIAEMVGLTHQHISRILRVECAKQA